MTYDVIIIIKTFYMSSRTYGENFTSIGKAVAEKTSMKYCRAIHSPPQAKTYKKLGLKPVTLTLASRPQFFYATPRLLKLYLCAKFEVAA